MNRSELMHELNELVLDAIDSTATYTPGAAGHALANKLAAQVNGLVERIYDPTTRSEFAHKLYMNLEAEELVGPYTSPGYPRDHQADFHTIFNETVKEFVQ